MDWNEIVDYGNYRASTYIVNSPLNKFWLGFVDAARAIRDGESNDPGDIYSIYASLDDMLPERKMKQWIFQTYKQSITDFAVLVTGVVEHIKLHMNYRNES